MAFSGEDVEGQDALTNSSICKICLKARSKYVCPRCSLPYCSVNCYNDRTHMDCSEAFYEENVVNNLKSSRISTEGRKRMMEILQKLNQENAVSDEELDSDDENTCQNDLAERIAGISLDDSEALWKVLSDSEKAAFKRLIASGDCSVLIPTWEPWWLKTFMNPKVVDLTDESKDNEFHKQFEIHKKKCPQVCENIKPFADICKKEPSNTVVYDLINVLSGYALLARYYNGDFDDFCDEPAAVLYNISFSLKSPQKFTSTEVAIRDVGIQAMIYKGIDINEEDVKLMAEDVKCIVNGPSIENRNYYILAALNDVQRMFSFYKKKFVKNKTGEFSRTFVNENEDINIIDKNACVSCIRRIEYFKSFACVFDFTKLK